MMRHAAALSLLGVLAACGDLGPTGPSFADDLALTGAQDLHFEDGRLALTWIESLEESKSVTKNIGRWGGTIELSTPGLRLWVPPFALDRTTKITMSARAGEDVAFDFGPHGTTFNHDVWVSIDLTKVLNGTRLIEELRQCSEPEGESGQTSASDKKKKKKKNKKKKQKKQNSSDDSDDDNNDDNDDNDDSDDDGDADDDDSDDDDSDHQDGSPTSSGSEATTSNSSRTANCAFSWFERLEGLDGVYMDPNVAAAVAHALEDFEVWVFMDRWLTFKTDHFSGYALAM